MTVVAEAIRHASYPMMSGALGGAGVDDVRERRNDLLRGGDGMKGFPAPGSPRAPCPHRTSRRLRSGSVLVSAQPFLRLSSFLRNAATPSGTVPRSLIGGGR